VSVVDERGREVLARRIDNSPAAFCGLLDELGGDLRVVVEATYGWEWLVGLLNGRECDLRLSHPQRTRAIATARIKTARVDANTLAQLLRADFSPESYIAPQQLRICATCCANAQR
jgi:transposase